MDYDKIVENAKKNSIGPNKRQKLVLKVKQVATTVAIVAVALTTAICTTGCARNYDRQMAQFYNSVYVEEAEAIMHEHGLNTQGTYDYDVYLEMDEISEENISGFYQLLGSGESEKAVRALGYEGWDDYLTQHGYIENGKPSFSKWEESWVAAREGNVESKGEQENGNESSRVR